MDFHGLSRRELQALCKRFQLPANLTNVAMADSLKALQIVEGVDEVLQACNSEIVQLSTGGRSTSRRNTAKRMDSVLKECAEEGRIDVLLTPAPLGATSRRKVKEDSAVKQVYSVRRSARLAAKSGNLLKGVGNDNPDFSRKDLFTGHGQEFEMNLKDSLDGSDEMSGVTNAESSPIEEDMDIHSESVGLTENSLKLLKEVGNKNLDFMKNDLSNDDGLVLLKESQDGLDVITGVASLEEERKGEANVDPSEKQAVPIDSSDADVPKAELNKNWGSEIGGWVDENVTETEENAADLSETESNPNESDSATLELTEGSAKSNDSLDCMPSEISSMGYEDDAFDWDSTQDVDDSKDTKQVLAIEEETVTVQPSQDVTTIGEVSPNPSIHLTAAQLSEEAADSNATLPPFFIESDPSYTVKPTLSTPKIASASKAYSRRLCTTAALDNKENIGSGSKTAPARERSKMVKEISEAVPKLDDHALVQLSKDLQINLNFLDKNENEVTPRTALRPLSDNRRDV